MVAEQLTEEGALELDSPREVTPTVHFPQTLPLLPEPGAELIGRQYEFALLWSHFEMAARGRASVVLIAGEPGIGKTRLIEEVGARASVYGATVLRGGASEAEGMPPYLPFLEALGQYIRTANADQLREQVGVAATPLATLLPEIAARLGELPPGYPLPAEQARLRLYEAVGEFLAAIASPRPLVLILDDLQWADTASLDLLCHLARRQKDARLLILGAYREDAVAQNPALERALAELNRLRLLRTLTLGPLSAAEVGTLAAQYLDQPAAPELRRLLHVQSEGNPFFAEELLRTWIETGALAQGGQHQQAVPGLADQLPSSIISALHVRLARLSPDVVDELRIAAIIGRTFTASLLATVTGQEVETVEAHLLEASRARLIRPEPDQSDAFSFSHDKIREYLYAEVSPTRRRRLHEAIGRALEAQPDPDNALHLAQLAFHLARSGDRARGALYSHRAADLALSAYAAREAVVHYRTALDLLDPDDRRRGGWLLRLGEAALLADDASEAATAYEAAQAWWVRAGSPLSAARAAHGLGRARWRLGQLPEARTSFERALALLQGRAVPEVVRVLVDLAALLGIHLGRHTEGLVHGHRALEWARQLKDSRLEAAASRTVGNLLVRENEIPAGVELLERALALARANDDPAEAARCCAWLAQAHFWVAELGRSYEVSRHWEEFAGQCQDPFLSRHVYSWLAFLKTCQGAWREAEQLIAKAQEVVDQLVSAEARAYLQAVRGFLSYQRGEYARAAGEFQGALTTYRTKDPANQALCLGALGMLWLTTGRRQEAQDCVAELEALIRALSAGSLLSGDSLPTGTVLSSLALIAIIMDDHDRAASYYPRLLAFQGQCRGFLIDRVLALIEARQGDWSATEAHLTQAETTARREGLRPELARTLRERAELELARGGSGSAARARALLGQALDLFQELGLEAEARRTRDRIGALPTQPGPTTHQIVPAGLSEREVAVLQLVAAGKSNRQIAEELYLSEKTVANHLTSILRKTGADNRAGAAAFALRHGLA